MSFVTGITIIAILLSSLAIVCAWACAAASGESEHEVEAYEYGLRRD